SRLPRRRRRPPLPALRQRPCHDRQERHRNVDRRGWHASAEARVRLIVRRQVELVLARRLEAAEEALRRMLGEILGGWVGQVILLHLGRLVVRAGVEETGEPAPEAHFGAAY